MEFNSQWNQIMINGTNQWNQIMNFCQFTSNNVVQIVHSKNDSGRPETCQVNISGQIKVTFEENNAVDKNMDLLWNKVTCHLH